MLKLSWVRRFEQLTATGRSLVVTERKQSDSSLSCPLPLLTQHFHHTLLKVNRHFVLPLLTPSLFLLSLLFHLLPLALRVLFELSFIAGTSQSIYNINTGSESLYWCQTAIPEKMTESFLKTLPPFLYTTPSCPLLSLLIVSFPYVGIFYFNMLPSSFCFFRLAEITMADRFDCDNCKESLYGRKYIQSDDSPYCIPCYDSLFSNTCDECKELIGHDARVRHPLWHDQTRNPLSAAQQQYQVKYIQNFNGKIFFFY